MKHITIVFSFLLILLSCSDDEGVDFTQVRPFSDKVLEAHNVWRLAAGQSVLVWNQALADAAAGMAQEISMPPDFEAGPTQYGRNIMVSFANGFTIEDAVNAWASSAENYDYVTNDCYVNNVPCDGCCDTYLQLVWGDTREVGCAVLKNDGTDIWVCLYDPGAVEGQRPF